MLPKAHMQFFTFFWLSVTNVNSRCEHIILVLTDDISATEICMVELNEEKVRAFAYAVKNDYWYQMYIDGLPIWGKVGEKEDKKYYIYTHKRFDIGYNNKRIVDVNIQTADKKELLVPGAKIKFTYEVKTVFITVRLNVFGQFEVCITE